MATTAAQRAAGRKALADGLHGILNGTATSDDVLAAVADVAPEAVPADTRARLRKQTTKERLTSGPALAFVSPDGEVLPVLAEDVPALAPLVAAKPADDRRRVAPADQAPEGMRRCQGAFKIGVLPHYAPLAEFTVQKSSKDGLAPYCKPCRHEDCRQGRVRARAAEPVERVEKPKVPKVTVKRTPARKPKAEPHGEGKRTKKAPAPGDVMVARVKHVRVGRDEAGEVAVLA